MIAYVVIVFEEDRMYFVGVYFNHSVALEKASKYEQYHILETVINSTEQKEVEIT